MTDFRITVRGLDAMIAALRDVTEQNIGRAQQELDRALDRTAETSRTLAHLHEGDLKASQSHSSEHGPTRWQGQVSYDARGAAFELQRGGDHAAYIDSLAAASEEDFEQAMDSVFRDL